MKVSSKKLDKYLEEDPARAEELVSVIISASRNKERSAKLSGGMIIHMNKKTKKVSKS